MFKTKHHLYATYRQMIQRCNHPTNSDYHNYGARGITVCARWTSDFWNFVDDMGEKPSSSHTLDRTNNAGPYNKDNCRWATKQEQNNNQHTNRLITHDSRTQTLQAWADELGLTRECIANRLNSGLSVPEALTNGHRTYKPITYHGKTMLLKEWAEHLGVNPIALKSRRTKGWSIERMLTQPFRKSPQ